jgi:multiple sugar transport system substrate-binding protein
MKHLSAKGWIVATVLSALPGAVLAEPVNISYLTHWSPETVALLETAAKTYQASNPDVTVTVRAVPFGDLLTTLRSQGGGSEGPTISGIYDLWLPELARDKLGACLSSHWSSGDESDSLLGYEQGLSPLENR